MTLLIREGWQKDLRWNFGVTQGEESSRKSGAGEKWRAVTDDFLRTKRPLPGGMSRVTHFTRFPTLISSSLLYQ